MEKRRIRLEINGVVCGLITQESEEYMQSLAGEVGELMGNILEASPYITREAAALTAALSYCDDAKKNGEKAFALQERVDELEVEAEIWQEEKAEMVKSGAAGSAASPDTALLEKLEKLERENTALTETAGRVKELEEKAARLTDENAALREAGPQPIAGGETAALETDNAALRQKAEEQAARAEQAEQEKQSAIAAAKRAVEEAKKMVDGLRAELAETREEARKARERASSPALDLLEKEVLEQGSEAARAAKGQERSVPPAGEQKPGGRKRRNPMRYEEEYEQEGFVSFFEKS